MGLMSRICILFHFSATNLCQHKYYLLMDQVLQISISLTLISLLSFSLSLHSSLQGLPFNRHDMFLCVIIRAKNVPVATDTPRKRKYSGHARSAESPDIQPHPEKKHQVREREREKMEERGRERNRKQRERECIELLFFYRLKLVLEEPLPPPLPLLPLKYPFTETQKILTRSLQLKFPKEQQQQKLNQMQLQLLV